MGDLDTKNLRMMPQRRAILEVIRDSHDHPSAAEIHQRVKARVSHISHGTVYNSVRALSERGDLLELTFGDGASRYDGRTDRHDHARCSSCGGLADVAAPLQPAVLDAAATATGYRLVAYHTEFSGVCPACAADGPGPALTDVRNLPAPQEVKPQPTPADHAPPPTPALD